MGAEITAPLLMGFSFSAITASFSSSIALLRLNGLIDLNDGVFEAGACKERFLYLHESLDN
jgi:hypothetical protein